LGVQITSTAYIDISCVLERFAKKNEKKIARAFNFMVFYIDDVLSLNNSMFGDFVDRIYPIQLEK
jgi:hypothetical protein